MAAYSSSASHSATLLRLALKSVGWGAGCAVVWAGLNGLGWPAAAQSVYSQAYTFSTLAGYAGNGSADGVGTDAQFYKPQGIAVDTNGNIYVADTENCIIRKITPPGVVTTIAGFARHSGSDDGTNSSARFNSPYGVAVDLAGNVYVADTFNCTIRKMTPVGTNWVVTTLAGLAGASGTNNGTGSAARFVYPMSAAVDSAGNVYVPDSSLTNTDYAIRKVTPAGVVTTLAAGFISPGGVAVDSATNVYVTDDAYQTICKITPAGVVTTLAAGFSYPCGVAVDSAGNLYVADTDSCTIRKVTPAGVVTTLAGLAYSGGDADGTGTNAQFRYPCGVVVNRAGNVYVADTANGLIRKVTSAGVVTTVAGTISISRGSAGGTGSAARFSSPNGPAVDSDGNVYVADTGNNTIREVTSSGVVSTIAGVAGVYGTNDGVGTEAHFFAPSGVAVDSADNLYVADTDNNTIRKVTPAGVVTTLAGTAGALTSGNQLVLCRALGSAARFPQSIRRGGRQRGQSLCGGRRATARFAK
jgi:sugar lactone lactonase YvrE